MRSGVCVYTRAMKNGHILYTPHLTTRILTNKRQNTSPDLAVSANLI